MTQLDVDDDRQFAGAVLPEPFLRTTLDSDDSLASEARDELWSVLDNLVTCLCDLELIERALRVAEVDSIRARVARQRVRSALAGFDVLFGGVDEAACAMTFSAEELRVP